MNTFCLCTEIWEYLLEEIPLYRLFRNGRKANGFTKGRDRSFHFGTQQYKIIGMISHLDRS
jgi:2-oxoisovalerate dehydrogenase E1 component